jgi:hypothetical protein
MEEGTPVQEDLPDDPEIILIECRNQWVDLSSRSVFMPPSSDASQAISKRSAYTSSVKA